MLAGFFLVLGGCQGVIHDPPRGGVGRPDSPSRGTLTVFAAASLVEPFRELGDHFTDEHPGVQVVFSFAGSQQLAGQLYQGAPADVYASANPRQMEVVISAGRVSPADVRTFAHNRLVLVYPANNPAGVLSLEDLAKPGLRLVLAAPEVPAGQYAQSFLQKASLEGALGTSYGSQVRANVVSYEENVRAVLTKVRLGEADAGIVYASDVVGEGSESLGVLTLPESLDVLGSYMIAPLISPSDRSSAERFIDLVLSPAGQAVLARWGLIPVGPTEAVLGDARPVVLR
jgi:molybdate transport system substrate-binding protein